MPTGARTRGPLRCKINNNNNNFSNLGDIIELKKSCNDIRYFISNNKDNSDDGVNFYNFITFIANFFIIIFKNCKKIYY